MSGLTPGVTLRKTFISASSPKATDELDCSPENSVECASRSSVVAGQPVEPQPVGSTTVRLPAASKARCHSAIASRSWSAS